ncbi:MAG: hypothetical protein NWR96_01125 [Crocinitomicaceae bacterium]|jgi:hypothetical protein|nr:hypothetical protein [Crocinitomicaceae bacterium]MDP4760207.1 hypothetical protein [Crocinitomicaceae bacterium]
MKIDALELIPDEQPKDHFLFTLSTPARRAIENNGITTLEQLSNYSKKEVLKFHGILWKENDRAIITFKSMLDIENGKAELEEIIAEWISSTK